MSRATLESLRAEAARLAAWLGRHPGAQRLLSGMLTRDEYVDFLIQTYHYVRWTTPLLRAAARRLRAQGGPPELARLMAEKAGEEEGHDRWVLSDLRALGCPRDIELATPPSAAIAAYVAWNRFTVEEGSPLALLGTAYVLEFLSVRHAGVAVRNLLGAEAIPGIQKAVTFLRGHSTADVGHVAELEQVLLQMTDPEDCEAIVHSASTTRALYAGLFARVGSAPQGRIGVPGP